MRDEKKRPLTDEERDECQRLLAIWKSRKADKAWKIRQDDMAERLEISQPAVGHYLHGRNRLNVKAATEFADYLGVSVSDFSPRLAKQAKRMKIGLRAMMASAMLPAPLIPFAAAAGTFGAVGSAIVSAMDDSDSEEQETQEEYSFIPQYDAAASGGPGHENGHVEIKGHLAFKRSWLLDIGAKPDNLIVVYLYGDSMAPTIHDGEVVLIDTSQKEPQSGKVYALVRPDGEVSAKRLIRRTVGDSWIIRSDNPDKTQYPDEEAAPDTLHEAPIMGRIIWRGGGAGL